MKTRLLLIAGIAAVGMMTSCASDNGDSPNNSGKNATVNLSFATGGTRTTTATDDGSNIGTNEGTVANMAIGLFDDGGSRVSAVPFAGNSETTDYTYSSSGTKITTTSSTTQIAVIANVPTVATTKLDLANSGTLSTFENKYTGLLVNTTSSDGTGSTTTPTTYNSQKTTGLPMYALTPVSFGSNTTITEPITLKRMVARICLTKLATDFSSYSDVTAKFVPTEIFMYNVKDQLTNWQTGTTAFSTGITESGTTGKCELTDQTTTTIKNITDATSNNYAYLSSGIEIPTSWSASAETPTTYLDCSTDDYKSANALSFYVFPNDAAVPTKMIIKGIFTPTGGTPAIVYYPIVINHAQTGTTITGNTLSDANIGANMLYNLKVTISGRGVSDPSKTLSPSTVTVNMTVTAWTQVGQTVNIQ